jgi:hypothetical protein
MALVEVQRGAQRHVPYRDSRLTYLLQVTGHHHLIWPSAAHALASLNSAEREESSMTGVVDRAMEDCARLELLIFEMGRVPFRTLWEATPRPSWWPT